MNFTYASLWLTGARTKLIDNIAMLPEIGSIMDVYTQVRRM